MGTNTVALVGLLLQATAQAQQFAAILNQAAAEGRDVSDAEVADAKTAAQAAIAALAAA